MRVVGTACGLGIEGSGWVIAPDEVVTNAHVVAGETRHDDRRGRRPPGALRARGGAVRPAQRPRDPRRAGASMRPRWRSPATPRRRRPPGRSSATRRTARSTREPARIGATQTVETQDAYGRGPVARQLTAVRGLIRPGQLGRPGGRRGRRRSSTTVFAATTSPGPSGGFGVANATVSAELANGRRTGFHRGLHRLSLRAGALRCAAMPPSKHEDSRDRREAVRRTRPRARAARPVRQARGLPRGARAHHHLGGRPPRAARRARRVRPEVQALADGGPADRARALQARRPRRALARSRCRSSRRSCTATTSARSSTPATPDARAS